MGGEAVAAVQPEHVVDQHEAADRHRYRQLLRAAFQGFAHGVQPDAFLEVLGLHELVDITHGRATFGIVIEHRVEHVFTHVLARWCGEAHFTAGQRVSVVVLQIGPVVQVQQQGVAAFHVLLVDLHHHHVVGTLLDEGAVVVQFHDPVWLAQIAVGVVGVDHHKARVELAAHGISNFDAMSGQFYARFVVVNTDNSDSYLRQPHRVMELHNDGTFVQERTDYVMMMKIDEQNMEGGNSLLLHLDDWEDLQHYYTHPLARREIRFTAPPSKNVREDMFHAVFDNDAEGRPTMRYIDQFVQPKDFEEGIWLNAMSESLEGCPQKLSVPVPIGSFVLVNNMFWLHGRDHFTAHQGLRRELMRQRGYISYQKTLYQRGQ